MPGTPGAPGRPKHSVCVLIGMIIRYLRGARNSGVYGCHRLATHFESVSRHPYIHPSISFAHKRCNKNIHHTIFVYYAVDDKPHLVLQYNKSVHHKSSEQDSKVHVTYSCPIVHANTLISSTFQKRSKINNLNTIALMPYGVFNVCGPMFCVFLTVG